MQGYKLWWDHNSLKKTEITSGSVEFKITLLLSLL